MTNSVDGSGGVASVGAAAEAEPAVAVAAGVASMATEVRCASAGCGVASADGEKTEADGGAGRCGVALTAAAVGGGGGGAICGEWRTSAARNELGAASAATSDVLVREEVDDMASAQIWRRRARRLLQFLARVSSFAG